MRVEIPLMSEYNTYINQSNLTLQGHNILEVKNSCIPTKKIKVQKHTRVDDASGGFCDNSFSSRGRTWSESCTSIVMAARQKNSGVYLFDRFQSGWFRFINCMPSQDIYTYIYASTYAMKRIGCMVRVRACVFLNGEVEIT